MKYLSLYEISHKEYIDTDKIPKWKKKKKQTQQKQYAMQRDIDDMNINEFEYDARHIEQEEGHEMVSLMLMALF